MLVAPLPSPLRSSLGLDDLLNDGWSRLQGGRAGGIPQAAPGESPPGHSEVPHGILPPSRQPGAFRSNSPHLFPALPQGQITGLRGTWAFVLICISATEVGWTPRRCRLQFYIHLLNNLQNKFNQWVRYWCIEM